MTQYLSQQRLLSLLWCAFWLGVLLGAVYQIFLIRRAAFRQMKIPVIPSALLLHTEDFLFCVTAGTAVSILFYACSDGVVRLMAFPALGIGHLLWRLTLGRLINACTQQILRLIAALCRLIRRWILLPIRRLLGKVVRKIVAALSAKREKKRLKRLWQIAKKETRRYRATLLQAASAGCLPADRVRIKQQGRKRKTIKDR